MFFSKILKNTNLDVVKTHKIAFVLSAVLICFSFFNIFTKGFNFGIDFSGGILIEAQMKEKVPVSEIRDVLSKENLKSFSLQEVGDDSIMIRISPQSDEENQTELATQVKNTLNQKFPDKFEYRKTDFVGPQVGSELIKKGLMALVISFVINFASV